jgi:hypothetical protein
MRLLTNWTPSYFAQNLCSASFHFAFKDSQKVSAEAIRAFSLSGKNELSGWIRLLLS